MAMPKLMGRRCSASKSRLLSGKFMASTADPTSASRSCRNQRAIKPSTVTLCHVCGGRKGRRKGRGEKGGLKQGCKQGYPSKSKDDTYTSRVVDVENKPVVYTYIYIVFILGFRVPSGTWMCVCAKRKNAPLARKQTKGEERTKLLVSIFT